MEKHARKGFAQLADRPEAALAGGGEDELVAGLQTAH